MNRFHIHVHVTDLESCLNFYSQLFGAEPAILKADYAKWLLEDPRINFAISANAAGNSRHSEKYAMSFPSSSSTFSRNWLMAWRSRTLSRPTWI